MGEEACGLKAGAACQLCSSRGTLSPAAACAGQHAQQEGATLSLLLPPHSFFFGLPVTLIACMQGRATRPMKQTNAKKQRQGQLPSVCLSGD